MWSKTSRGRAAGGGSVVEQLAEPVGHLRLDRGVRIPRRLEVRERRGDRGEFRQVEPGELATEEVAVLGGHTGAVGRVGRGRVGGVADQRDPTLGPLLERLSVADHPPLHVARLGRRDQVGQRVGEPGGEAGRARRGSRPVNSFVASWAVSTHHWKPSRPWWRIAVQLPCVVRLWETMHGPARRPGRRRT